MRGIGGFYYCMGEDGEVYTLRAQAKFRRDRIKPMVGDYVEMEPGTGEEDGWITAILDRKTVLSRPPVANIDTLLLVVAAATPDPDLELADKMALQARMAGIRIVLAINKCDLAPESAADVARQYRGVAESIHTVSARRGDGVEELRQALRGRVTALAGQSGAGKSSLINALYGLTLETGSLSRKIERGKNTTRSCELHQVEGGGMVLDTPGFSLIDAPLMDPEELQKYYPEFEPYRGGCYFPNCCHATEPGCAVREQVEAGTIDPDRHERYVRLVADMRLRWKARYNG